MKRILFVPGPVTNPDPITLPADAPDIDVVVSAEIERFSAAVLVADHPPADIVAAIADHAVHAHDLVIGSGGGIETGTFGTGAALESSGAGGTVVGAGAQGVQNNPAAQAHSATATPVVHGPNTVASPVVAANPTQIDNRTFSLDVNTLAGDVLALVYQEVGVLSHP